MNKNIRLALYVAVIATLTACLGSKQYSNTAEVINNHLANTPIKPNKIVTSVTDKRQYLSIILPNQLQVILISDPTVKKSAAALSVAVGSYQEPNGFGGLAHYLEHMLFLGTKSYPKVGDYSVFLSRNGGFDNAYTQVDHTNYMMTVNNNAYPEALHRFSGFFYEPLLSVKYADKERNSVNSEWTMKSPDDEVILEQLNGTTLNPNHPISQFNWGNLETLSDHGERKLQTQLVNFYNKYYSANIMKAVLISNLPISELKKLANTYFAVIPNKNIAKPQVMVSAATPAQLKKIIHYLPQTDMKALSLKFVITDNSDQFALKPNKYVSYLLNNEMPGALAPTLRNMGLIENLSSYVHPTEYGNSGNFSIEVKLTEQGVKNKDKIIGVIFKYIDLIKNKGIDQKYFTEIKQSLNNSFRFKEKIADYAYAWDIAAELQFKPTNYVLSGDYEYQHFDSKAISNVLAQLTIDNVRIFYIDKKQPVNKKMHFFKGQYSVEDITVNKIASWQQAAAKVELNLPATNSLMPKNFALVTAKYTNKPKALINEAGLNLYLGHSRYFKQPKGSFIANFNSSLNDKSPRNAVMAALLAKGLDLALMPLKTEALAAGMRLDFYNSKGVTLVVDGFTDQQENLLARTYNIIRSYQLSENELANLKAAYLSEKASAKKKMLLRQLFPNLSLLMNLSSFGDKSLLAEVKGISIKEITAFRDQLLQRTHLNIFAFGNYSEQQAIKNARLLKSLLPKNRQYAKLYQEALFHPQAGTVVNWQQEADLTDMAFVDVLLQPLSVKQHASVKVLSQILSPALYNQIRTEEQLAYAVGFFNRVLPDQLMMGFYIQSSVKGPAAVAKRIELFKQGFVKTLAQMTPKEFSTIKQSTLVTLTQPPKNLNEESSSFYQDWRQQKFVFDSKIKLIAAVKNVTLADINGLYQSSVSANNYGRVVVQMRGTNFKDKPFTDFEKVEQVVNIDAFHSKSL